MNFLNKGNPVAVFPDPFYGETLMHTSFSLLYTGLSNVMFRAPLREREVVGPGPCHTEYVKMSQVVILLGAQQYIVSTGSCVPYGVKCLY